MGKSLKVYARDRMATVLPKNLVTSLSVLPEWYKNLKPLFPGTKSWTISHRALKPTSTVKWCQPFMDSMTTGYMLVLQTDIKVEPGDDEPEFLWSIDYDFVTTHDDRQLAGMPVSEEFYPHVYKFNNNTGITAPKGYSLLFMHPLNRQDLPFYSFSGVVDADDYRLAVSIPFVMKKEFDGIIPAGTPIAQVIPIKREDWSREELPYDEESNAKDSIQFFGKIYRSYKNNFWKRKSYN